MKRPFLLSLLLCFSSIAFSQTEAEKAFMKSIQDTLGCTCSSCNGIGYVDQDPSPSPSDSAVAYWTLYKDQMIYLRGCFHNKKLMCGIWCVYDSDNRLEKVKIYRDGILIGEAVMPR